MHGKLISWGRAVKAQRRLAVPVLWLFTDAGRLADPLPAVAGLPWRGAARGLCGVVFRHDGVPGRAALAARVAALCRARGLALCVAGDWRLAAALGAGEHRRGAARMVVVRRGVWPKGALVTSSAHGVAELRRARRTGALAFVSPVFATPSHPGARGLGPARFAALAGRAGTVAGRAGAVAGRAGALALGGVNAGTVRRLPRGSCYGAGAITALAGGGGPRGAAAARRTQI